MEKNIPPVNCVDCGFLALMNEEFELYESPDSFRKTGLFPKPGPNSNSQLSAIICTVRECDIFDGTSDVMAGNLPKHALRMISEPKKCRKHFPWIQGFTPKEHVQMMHNESIIREMEERRQADMQWRERQDATRQKWESREKQKDRTSRFWRGLIAAFITTVWGIVLPIIVYQYFKIPKP